MSWKQLIKKNADAAAVFLVDAETSQGSAGAARPSERPSHRQQQDRKSRWWLQPTPECEEGEGASF